MALAGASILSMTFVPAAVALLVTGNVSEHENFFMRGARRIYAPLLAASIRNRLGVVADRGAVLSSSAVSRQPGWEASSFPASTRAMRQRRSSAFPAPA